MQLLGYARVELEPGESVRLTFTVPTTRFAFSDRRMTKIVEPGDVEVWVGSHAAAAAAEGPEEITRRADVVVAGPAGLLPILVALAG